MCMGRDVGITHSRRHHQQCHLKGKWHRMLNQATWEKSEKHRSKTRISVELSLGSTFKGPCHLEWSPRIARGFYHLISHSFLTGSCKRRGITCVSWLSVPRHPRTSRQRGGEPIGSCQETSEDRCAAWQRRRGAFEVSMTTDVSRVCKINPGEVEMGMVRAVKAEWGWTQQGSKKIRFMRMAISDIKSTFIPLKTFSQCGRGILVWIKHSNL